MKYYQNLLKQWAAPIYFPVISQWSLSFSSSIIFSHIQHMLLDRKFSCFCFISFSIKMFFHYFFTVIKLFMHHLGQIISCIFSAVKNNLLAEFIISTDKFISKAARNVTLIIFCIRTTCFSSLLTIFKIHSKSAIDFIWCW